MVLPRPRRRLVSVVGAIVVSAGLAGLGLTGCDRPSPQAAGPAAPAAKVSTTQPAAVTVPARSGPVIRIEASDVAQTVVDAAPAGAQFLLGSGVHRRFSVQPKSHQVFVAEPGTVLDGEGTEAHAFFAFRADHPTAEGVTISGASRDAKLEIRNYAGPLQTGAIHPQVDTRPELGLAAGWTVQWCDIHDNAATGIRVADDMAVRENEVHRNGQLGIGGTGRDIVIAGNEVADNRTRDDVDPSWEGGGIKLVTTVHAQIIGNVVRDNRGNGIWTDIDAVDTVVADNTVTANEGAGIFDEISYGAQIRDNVVTGNGTVDNGWFWNAGIQIAASSNLTVTGNTLTANRQGIMLLQQRRGSGSNGPHRVANVEIANNRVIDSGVTGVARDDLSLSLDLSSITFKGNEYDPVGPSNFVWDDALIDQTAWRAAGHDT